MGSSSEKLFNREKTIHDILGGGNVADVMLGRKKNVSVGIVTVTIASWMVFESFAYTIITLLSSVLLLLLSILFLWSKSASILNRPSPPLPEFQISEAMAEEASRLLRIHVNKLLQVSYDIAMGRNSELYIKVAVSLFLISFIGSLMDFQTLCHTSVLVVMTVPAIYERYEDYIDGSMVFICNKARDLCLRFELLAFPEHKKLS
ncbi:Reticulon-like protein B12 [Cardamine amara subsp. amara]|uniref:Reticulon-like protein n=1 Tax=Cardamine amara subsp. amara TaxID=228776 RepID=A0ABD1A3L9_CARAN